MKKKYNLGPGSKMDRYMARPQDVLIFMVSMEGSVIYNQPRVRLNTVILSYCVLLAASVLLYSFNKMQ